MCNFDWNRVLWSDETKMKRFDNQHLKWIWCKNKDSYKKKTTVPTVKNGGGSVMLWGFFLIVTFHSILDSMKYKNIINQYLAAKKLGQQWIFQQDNTLKHMS